MDLREYRLPYDKKILSVLESREMIKCKIPELIRDIKVNNKNKNTAIYYIIAKKLVKDGF